ncbi:type IV toxin-antitoxin system AbiEi family antitoxin domain-containing protein [Desulfonatronovibrio hydrogenovorans]|uniref:type IV toxin-antitoxin system AbiEi family antitoxin domain-containing protein n=1 Tax=Desulfonatronovibrio hydrogenovorans TaxID=53245 RepID=UPI0012373FCF|nr:type IV toxin-antitoxin system AbiEi family antitoxin [Desulfonatronovibrio hydrogenovorans]
MNGNKKEKLKTLGPRAAYLVGRLYEQGKPMFSNADVMEITGLQPKSARNFVASLVNRGVATRLKPGLFILVPYELGFESEYLGNPYILGRELAGRQKYYISHASAMDIHQMVTQPQLKVFVSVARSIRPRMVLGTEYHFVRCRPEHFFGIEKHWATKTDSVQVSDPERTIIDCLKLPQHCGGLSETAKGLWIKKQELDLDRLIGYAVKVDVGAVIRRLGFLLEIFQMASDSHISNLQQHLSKSYVLLDPVLPHEGKYLARWRLRLNMEPDELLALVRT